MDESNINRYLSRGKLTLQLLKSILVRMLAAAAINLSRLFPILSPADWPGNAAFESGLRSKAEAPVLGGIFPVIGLSVGWSATTAAAEAQKEIWVGIEEKANWLTVLSVRWPQPKARDIRGQRLPSARSNALCWR